MIQFLLAFSLLTMWAYFAAKIWGIFKIKDSMEKMDEIFEKLDNRLTKQPIKKEKK